MTTALRGALLVAACAVLSMAASSNGDGQQEGIIVNLVPPPPLPPASNDIGSWRDAQDMIDQEFLRLYQVLSNDNHQPVSHEEKLPSSNDIPLPSSNDGSLPSSNDPQTAKQHAWSNPKKQLAYVNGIVVDLSQIGPCSAGECCPKAPPLLARHDALPSWLRSRIAARRIADAIDRPSSNGDHPLSSDDSKHPSSNDDENDEQRPCVWPECDPEEAASYKEPSSNAERQLTSNDNQNISFNDGGRPSSNDQQDPSSNDEQRPPCGLNCRPEDQPEEQKDPSRPSSNEGKQPSSNGNRHPSSNGIRIPNRALRVELAYPPQPQQHGIGPCGEESCSEG